MCVYRVRVNDVAGRIVRKLGLTVPVLVAALTVTACGDAPLESVGRRSSDWIAEPTIHVTTTVAITVPIVFDSENLVWFNDSIPSGPLSDRQLLRDEVFARRGSDLIVQANRTEIGVLAPSVKFPSVAPAQAEYVTSQVVFDRDGSLSDEPLVGFGLWSSEPYTRSRTVAQLAVLWVSKDALGVQEATTLEPGVSCARFSDASTTACDLIEYEGRPVWDLESSSGTTLVFFDDIYRYELFVRNTVSEDALFRMVSSFTELDRLGGADDVVDNPEPSDE